MNRILRRIHVLAGLAICGAPMVAAAGPAPDRETVPLDGKWGIVFDRADEGRAASWWTNDAAFAAARPIAVPSCWEETEKDYEGVAWYRRSFDVPAAWKGRCVRLEFDAVNYLAEVWINGLPAGDHEGGYTPFDLEVSDLLAYSATNTLTVRVAGPAVRTDRVGFLLRDEAPHWRGGYVGGIWQPVRLVASAPVFVREVFVEPRPSAERAVVHVTVDNVSLAPAAAAVTVDVAPAGEAKPVASRALRIDVPPGGIATQVEMRVARPRLWSPDAPHLYSARVAIDAGAGLRDETAVRFGMREFTLRNGRFELNGRPILVKGAFWEGQYPNTLARMPDLEVVRREIRLAKEAGFNLLRPWRMPPVPSTLDLADELGVLIVGSPPIECMNQWPALTPALERRWTREMEDLVRRDRNHASVVMWETGNEVVRRSLYLLRHKVSLAARRLDPTRLILDESGGRSWSYGGHPHLLNRGADYDGLAFARGPHLYLPGETVPRPIDDFHIYVRAPLSGKDRARLARPGTNALPVFVSEFGYGGWPDVTRNVERYRAEGNPLAPDFRFHERLLASLERVMDAHELRGIFPDASALCLASQRIQADGNLLQIEAIRSNAESVGYCLHAFTDGDWVVGAGVLDMWREPKLLYDAVKEANAPVRLLVRSMPPNVRAGEPVRVAVTVANDGPPVAGRLEMAAPAAGWSTGMPVRVAAGVTPLAEFPVPTAGWSGEVAFHAALVDGSHTAAVGRASAWAFARAAAPAGLRVTTFEWTDRLKPFLKAQGVTAEEFRPGTPAAGPVLVAPSDVFKDGEIARFKALRAHVEAGGTAVWLMPPADDSRLVREGILPLAPGRVQATGMWIPANHYARRHPVFDGLPSGGFMGQVYANAAPRFTMTNLPGRAIAGCVSWGHEKDYTGPTEAWHGADVAMVPCGKGRMIFSTLDLLPHLGADPVADRLLLNLCAFAASMGPGPGGASATAPPDAARDRPNVVVVLMDDLGWKDPGCCGGTFIETPRTDRLAAEGMRFTQAYAAAPVCSPTRASLLTGRAPGRLGMYEVLNLAPRPFARMTPPPNRTELPDGAPTVAEILAPAGRACGSFGKWHVGRTPQEEGFVVPPRPAADPALDAWAAARPHKKTGPIAADAVRFLRANRDRPFLLMVNFHAVHAPMEASERLVAKYRAKAVSDGVAGIDPVYAAMTEEADEAMGLVLDELAALGLADRTAVIFTSDNGGLIADPHLTPPAPLATCNLPLRSQKGDLYEGGIRVPLIVRWPGATHPGSLCAEPVITPDLFATVLDIAGVRAPEGPMDGMSLVPLLRGGAWAGREALYWHFPTSMWSRWPGGAIRKGRHKLMEFFDDGRAELYDLEADPGETRDLAASRPDLAAALRADLAAWRAAIGAAMPVPNPVFDPVRADEFPPRAGRAVGPEPSAHPGLRAPVR
jgi:arylsulfatase A-like enzyme